MEGRNTLILPRPKVGLPVIELRNVVTAFDSLYGQLCSFYGSDCNVFGAETPKKRMVIREQCNSFKLALYFLAIDITPLLDTIRLSILI